jgi:hypothetical protein
MESTPLILHVPWGKKKEPLFPDKITMKKQQDKTGWRKEKPRGNGAHNRGKQ